MKILSIALFCSVLAGCASTYVHESLTDQAVSKKQFMIDDAECLRQSYGAAAPTQYIDNSRSKSNGFSKGFNNSGGNDIGNAIVRGKIYNGCMLSKGWSKSN